MSRSQPLADLPPPLPTVPSGIDPLVRPCGAARGGRVSPAESAPIGEAGLGPPLLSVKAAAWKLGISERSLWRQIARRKIAVVRIGRATRIDPDELRRFIRAQTTGPRR